MARVEVEHKGVKGIVTDGYFPSSFSYYKGIDWKRASKEKFPLSEEAQRDFKQNIYHRYMGRRTKEPEAGPRSNLYRKMKGMLEDRFCQYNKSPCAQFQFPVVGVHRMELIVAETEKKNWDKVIPAFSREIENDLAAGKDTYVFHLDFLDLNPDNYCPSFEECTKNWMEFMGFEIKKVEDYVDFESYENAVRILLKEDIEGNVPYSGWFEK